MMDRQTTCAVNAECNNGIGTFYTSPTVKSTRSGKGSARGRKLVRWRACMSSTILASECGSYPEEIYEQVHASGDRSRPVVGAAGSVGSTKAGQYCRRRD